MIDSLALLDRIRRLEAEVAALLAQQAWDSMLVKAMGATPETATVTLAKRAIAIAEGRNVVEMPVDPRARAVVEASHKALGEEDK